ncbi:CGL138 [Auxenochlorella protothecoides x Auxenochlorella symbiontica]
MISPWWAAGVAVPALLLRATKGGRKPTPDRAGTARLDSTGSDPSFVCERVCTSDRLMRRLGGLAKDATPNTCVTVCGTSSQDACASACTRSVCTNLHQVPAWNDTCIERCSSECVRGRSA